MSSERGDPHAAAIREDGLAGIRIGDHQTFVLEELGLPARRREGAAGLLFDYDGFTVSLRDGVVDALIAGKGYIGETANGIMVGMPWLELKARAVEIEFDEELLCWRAPPTSRIELVIGRPLRDSEWADEGDDFAPELYSVTDPMHAHVAQVVIRP